MNARRAAAPPGQATQQVQESSPSPGLATKSLRPARAERGFATLLIALYGVLAFAATGRAVYEVAVKFSEAPLSYALSLASAITYAVVTVLLVRRGGDSRAALWVVGAELVGVLTVGTLTTLAPRLFHAHTVWSHFGVGYGFLPVILPVVALGYLVLRRRRSAASHPAADPS